MSEQPSLREQLKLDGDALYREENFSDRRTGSIQRLVPVTAEGDQDPDRTVRYVGQTQVMSPAGALPITFELDVESLAAAIDAFPAAAEQAVAETIEEIKRLQREQQSSIVMPGQGGSGMQGGPGNIQF